MKTELSLHPLCTLFPRLTGSEFESLKDDIRENGLREPIIIHDGMILDGGNRYRACLEIGIDPGVMKFGGGNLVSYVISANLHRRHLTPGQQAAIVASAQDWGKAQTVGNPQLRNVAQLDTAKDRSVQSGASLRTQQMADKVAKSDPELAKKVGHGEISLPKAIKEITPQKENQFEESKKKDTEFQHISAEDLMEEMAGELDTSKELENAGLEIERLNNIINADDSLAAAMAEIKRLTALCQVLEDRLRGATNRENELKRHAQAWRAKHDKLEKLLKKAGLVEF